MTSNTSIVPGRTSRSRNVRHEGSRYCLNRIEREVNRIERGVRKSNWKCVIKTSHGRITLLDDITAVRLKTNSHPADFAVNAVHSAKQTLKQPHVTTRQNNWFVGCTILNLFFEWLCLYLIVCIFYCRKSKYYTVELPCESNFRMCHDQYSEEVIQHLSSGSYT